MLLVFEVLYSFKFIINSLILLFIINAEKSAFLCTIYLFNQEFRNYIFSGNCQEGWDRIGESCYLFANDTVLFDVAKSRCEDLGAHLVSINSEEENENVADLRLLC